MLPIPLYRNSKLTLAFEYGVVLSEVAKERGVELTREIVERAEQIIVREFSRKSPSKLACEMEVNLLAAFEPD